MLTNVKTFALLMLTAGLALGVFAGTLIASPKQEIVSGISRVDIAVEAQLAQYRRAYDLDVAQLDLLRHELVRYRRQVHDTFSLLMEKNRDRFDDVSGRSLTRIEAIIGPQMKASPKEAK